MIVARIAIWCQAILAAHLRVDTQNESVNETQNVSVNETQNASEELQAMWRRGSLGVPTATQQPTLQPISQPKLQPGDLQHDDVNEGYYKRRNWTGSTGAGVHSKSAKEGIAKDPRDIVKENPSVAILLFGETFRDGGQDSRITGSPASEISQRKAAESLMEKFVRPLKRNGYRVLCFIATSKGRVAGIPSPKDIDVNIEEDPSAPSGANLSTPIDIDININEEYMLDTNQTQMLMEWYSDCMPPNRESQPLSTSHRSMQEAVGLYNKISKDNTTGAFFPADYFILMRPDMIFKQDMYGYWNKSKDSVAFPFHEWCAWNLFDDCRKDWPGKCWRVPDRLVALPRHGMEIVLNKNIDLQHKMYKRLVNTNDNWISTHLKFWLNEDHDSDSGKDWNPMYEIAGRESTRSPSKLACHITKKQG